MTHNRTGTARRSNAAAATAILIALSACGGTASSAEPPAKQAARAVAPAPRSSAVAFDGASSVGVLIDRDGEHFCTASVVDSPKGNVVATAAHCIQDAGGEPDHEPGELRFAPEFSGNGNGNATNKDQGRTSAKAKGVYPYGQWKVGSVHIDDRWTDDADDADAADYAFLTLEPDPKGRQVQQVVGAAKPDWESEADRRVTVVGYPNQAHNPANRPVACTTDTRPDPESPEILLMECAGFWEGTSGAPWLADYRDAQHQGRLIGVLSGGDTDRESTAALFDAKARDLYEQAAGQ
ncbi:trypsin-like serine peptidase [Streptomyces sp. NPDC020681]|uniref:trypsin-like serine peptidase n=1 Tax=Streptomyces sp. NPDC020681 TaxID=3365083 RepID=UPI0037906A08